MTYRKQITATFCSAALAATLWFLVSRNSRDSVAIEPPASPALDAASADPIFEEPPTWTPDAEKEVLATRMMYLAHAPLRDRSVDDPDSPENVAIFQQMISKALAVRSQSETTAQAQ